MCKLDETWSCNNCNSFESKSSNQVSELEGVKSKVQAHETLDENDLETSLALAAKAGNALLHENIKLKQDIENMHNYKTTLEANLASMEAKMEELLTRGISQTPTEKLSLTIVEKDFIHTTNLLAIRLTNSLTEDTYSKENPSAPSDHEDYDVIVVEAQVYHSAPALKKV
ncbi:hypothetical protein J6590_058078 [Homalodisca vitripennis]|nr:hypothetical protein J6590_058078 [Homalodisca vitripennis]